MYNLPKNAQELLHEAQASILFTTVRPDIVMERGKGMYLWDTNGKRYLDFIGGWATTCLGHCPEVITTALAEQSCKLVNASPTFFNKPMLDFAKLLTDYTCFDRVFFATSGAEANEGAIKLARKYGAKYLNGAYEIITTINGFHGRTLATMSATGKQTWENLFAPKVPGFKHVPLNDIAAVSAAIGPQTCAVMLEPIQGEGGVFTATAAYLQALRNICDNTGVLLIFDEIQTGIGRTGKLCAYEHFSIEPDIMTLAKGIGGGFPLSALLTKEQYNIFEAGDQGGTYSAQPLAMAVGFAVVSEVIKQNLAENAKIQGAYIMEKLQSMEKAFNLSNIRGKGLLIAFDLPRKTGSTLVAACLQAGLIINSPRPSTIRLMPPLIVDKTNIDDMASILTQALAKILN